MASELDLVTSHLFLIVMKISNDAAIHRILSTKVATRMILENDRYQKTNLHEVDVIISTIESLDYHFRSLCISNLDLFS